VADDEGITRGERLRKLLNEENKNPLGREAFQRRNLLSDMIIREAPDEPIRTPLEEKVRGTQE
jgi:hypothetical protein